MSGNQSSSSNTPVVSSTSSLTVSSSVLVNMIPLSPNPAYSTVVAALIGDSTYSQVQGSGGWQVVDRPKSHAATQWYDRSPFQISMDLLIDDAFLGQGEGATETMCQQLESWLELDPLNPGNYQPTTFIMTGPLPGLVTKAGAREWFLFNLSFTEAVRKSANTRIQQKLSVVCYEYSTPIPGGNSYATAATASPASAAAKFLTTSGGTAYLGTTPGA